MEAAIMRTCDLCLRLLRAVVLGEDRRCNDSKSSEELKRSYFEHGSGTAPRLSLADKEGRGEARVAKR